MKKRLLVAIALVLIASVVLAAPAAAKQCHQMKPLVMIETMTAGLQDHPDTWYGNVKGDINGSQEGWNIAFDPATPKFGLVDPIFLGGVGPSYNLIITRCGDITFYTTAHQRPLHRGKLGVQERRLCDRCHGQIQAPARLGDLRLRVHHRPQHVGG